MIGENTLPDLVVPQMPGLNQGIMQQGRPGAGLVALQLEICLVSVVQTVPRVAAAPPCTWNCWSTFSWAIASLLSISFLLRSIFFFFITVNRK